MTVNQHVGTGKKSSIIWIVSFAVIGIILSILFSRVIAYYQGNNQAVRVFVWVMHFIALALLGLFVFLIIKKQFSLEKCFLLIAIPLGIVYMLIITPLSIPDEPHHYQTAFQLSNHLMFQGSEEDYGDSQYFDYSMLTPHQNTCEGYEKLLSEIGKAGTEGEDITIPGPRRLYYAVMYLPQALGIVLGRIFKANFLVLFYLGRLFNLLFYVLCVYFALKITPKYKTLLFGIGFMPMAFQQAASYSYDAYINGIVILYIALIIKAIYSEKIMKRWEYLSLMNVGMFLAPAKVVYVPISLLLLLIPRERFGDMKKKILSLVGFYGAIGVFLAVIWLPSVLGGDAVQTMAGIEPYSVSFMLAHPIHTIDVMVWTLKDLVVEWLSQAAGFRLSGLTLVIPQYISYLYLTVLLIMSVRTEQDPLPVATKVQRLVYAGITLVVVGLTMTYLLISWTSIDSFRIAGIQGRYFIPVLPLLFMALDNTSIRRKENMDKYLVFDCVLLNFIVIDNVLGYTITH